MHKGEDEVYAAFVGIDWADKKHDVCLQVAGSAKRERLVLEHRPGVIQAWAEQLRERFGGAPVAVSVELTRGPVVSALLEHDFFRLFPVLPTTVANYRKAFAPSGAKDDPTDAEVILELLARHRDKLKPLQPESADMRALRRLVEWRRHLVQDRTRLTNRITDDPVAWSHGQVDNSGQPKPAAASCSSLLGSWAEQRRFKASSARRAHQSELPSVRPAHRRREAQRAPANEDPPSPSGSLGSGTPMRPASVTTTACGTRSATVTRLPVATETGTASSARSKPRPHRQPRPRAQHKQIASRPAASPRPPRPTA